MPSTTTRSRAARKAKTEATTTRRGEGGRDGRGTKGAKPGAGRVTEPKKGGAKGTKKAPSSSARRRCIAVAKKNTGHWYPLEHYRFLEGVDMYGEGDWVQISKHVRTRTAVQCKTHNQKVGPKYVYGSTFAAAATAIAAPAKATAAAPEPTHTRPTRADAADADAPTPAPIPPPRVAVPMRPPSPSPPPPPPSRDASADAALDGDDAAGNDARPKATLLPLPLLPLPRLDETIRPAPSRQQRGSHEKAVTWLHAPLVLSLHESDDAARAAAVLSSRGRPPSPSPPPAPCPARRSQIHPSLHFPGGDKAITSQWGAAVTQLQRQHQHQLKQNDFLSSSPYFNYYCSWNGQTRSNEIRFHPTHAAPPSAMAVPQLLPRQQQYPSLALGPQTTTASTTGRIRFQLHPVSPSPSVPTPPLLRPSFTPWTRTTTVAARQRDVAMRLGTKNAYLDYSEQEVVDALMSMRCTSY